MKHTCQVSTGKNIITTYETHKNLSKTFAIRSCSDLGS